MGKILTVDNFDIYDGTTKVYDGSKIIGFMGDKSWFRIKEQEMTMDEFYNPNNRTWQMYLNDVRMYQYSLFANGVVFATEEPQVNATAIKFAEESITFGADQLIEIGTVITTPYNATGTITYTSSDTDVVTVSAFEESPKQVSIVKVRPGTATVTATLGNLTATLSVTVPENP